MVGLLHTVKLHLVGFGVEFKGIKTVFCTLTLCVRLRPFLNAFYKSKVATLQYFY
jgi:hypothetical protein